MVDLVLADNMVLQAVLVEWHRPSLVDRLHTAVLGRAALQDIRAAVLEA